MRMSPVNDEEPNSDEVDDGEFENVFGVTKHRYFSAEAIDEWTEQVELL